MRAPDSAKLFLAIFFVAFALRALPLAHGLPGLHVPDTHSVRNALGILQTRNPVPRSNEFSSYPYLYSYLCLPIFLGITRRRGSRGARRRPPNTNVRQGPTWSASTTSRAGSRRSRAPSPRRRPRGGLILGAEGGNRRRAARGALPFEFLLSTHERPWSLVFLFTALALGASLRAMEPRARRKPLFLAGLAAGAAAGSHQTGILAILLPLAAAWFRPAGLAPAALAASARDAAAVVAGFLPTFFVGNPYLLLYGPKGGVAAGGPGTTDVSIGGQGLVLKFHFARAAESLAGSLDIGGVVCALAAAGAVLLVRRRDRRAGVLLGFALPILAFFTAYDGSHARYLLLTLPALWVLGGAGLAALGSRGKLGLALAAAALAAPAFLTLRTAQLLLRLDTRAIALGELERRIPEGASVAVEPYGPALQPSVASLRRADELERTTGNAILTRRERLALERQESGGFDVLPLERVVADPAPGGYRALGPLAKDLYPGAADLAAVLAAAGVRYVVSVDRFPGEPRADPLASLLAARGKLLWEVRPQGNDADPLRRFSRSSRGSAPILCFPSSAPARGSASTDCRVAEKSFGRPAHQVTAERRHGEAVLDLIVGKEAAHLVARGRHHLDPLGRLQLERPLGLAIERRQQMAVVIRDPRQRVEPPQRDEAPRRVAGLLAQLARGGPSIDSRSGSAPPALPTTRGRACSATAAGGGSARRGARARHTPPAGSRSRSGRRGSRRPSRSRRGARRTARRRTGSWSGGCERGCHSWVGAQDARGGPRRWNFCARSGAVGSRPPWSPTPHRPSPNICGGRGSGARRRSG